MMSLQALPKIPPKKKKVKPLNETTSSPVFTQKNSFISNGESCFREVTTVLFYLFSLNILKFVLNCVIKQKNFQT